MIRAYIVERDEYLYPDSDSFLDLSYFYGVLEGYRIKGLTCIIDQYSGVQDYQGREIYESDLINVDFSDKSIRINNNPKQQGHVTFSNGGFWMVTDDKNLWALSNTTFGETFYKIKLIKGRKKDERIKQV